MQYARWVELWGAESAVIFQFGDIPVWRSKDLALNTLAEINIIHLRKESSLS